MCALPLHVVPLFKKETHELCFVKQILFSFQYMLKPLIGEMFWEVCHWAICLNGIRGSLN